MGEQLRIVASALTAVLLALGATGCGPDGPDVVDGQAVDVDDTRLRPGDSLPLIATEFEFSPDDIVAEPGRYTGELANEGALRHNLTFSDGTTFDAPPGETVPIEFDVPEGGLTFICSIEGHEAAGMRGEIHTPETHDDA